MQGPFPLPYRRPDFFRVTVEGTVGVFASADRLRLVDVVWLLVWFGLTGMMARDRIGCCCPFVFS